MFALLSALAGLSPTVIAAQLFNFSYTFGSGNVASGSFWGDSNGSYVENIYGATVLANGMPNSGSGNLYVSNFVNADPINGHSTNGRIYFDGNLNNFAITESNWGNREWNGNSWFYYTTINLTGVKGVSVGDSTNVPKGWIDCAVCYGSSGAADASRWILTAVNPVPEPESYAMMLAGLGLLGVAAGRRKQKAVA